MESERWRFIQAESVVVSEAPYPRVTWRAYQTDTAAVTIEALSNKIHSIDCRLCWSWKLAERACQNASCRTLESEYALLSLVFMWRATYDIRVYDSIRLVRYPSHLSEYRALPPECSIVCREGCGSPHIRGLGSNSGCPDRWTPLATLAVLQELVVIVLPYF